MTTGLLSGTSYWLSGKCLYGPMAGQFVTRPGPRFTIWLTNDKALGTYIWSLMGWVWEEAK